MNNPTSKEQAYSSGDPLAASPESLELAATRGAGGRSTHLSEPAQALVLGCIIAGQTNREINQALVRARHLKRGETLSRQSLTNYRKDPRARVEIHRLTDEAIQTGHVALSESIVVSTESFRACCTDLFKPDGSHKKLSAGERNALVREMHLAMRHVWECLGRDDLLQAVLRAEENILGELDKKTGMTPEERLAMENSIKRGLLEVMKRVGMPAASASPAGEISEAPDNETATP